MGLKIIEEGLQTTVQDLGRYGYQSYGFSVNGAMDKWAMKIANILVNNDEQEAVIEMSYIGPTISFEGDMIIALTGADMSPKLNGKNIPLGKVVSVKSGDELQLKPAKKGLHTYLAVQGGLKLPIQLNSKSTSLQGGFGGYLGRRLQIGDVIKVNQQASLSYPALMVSTSLFNYIGSKNNTLHFIEGRQYGWFTDESQQIFENSIYHTTTQSNRMGYRLSGPSLATVKNNDLLTEATAFGTIQVPPNGQPIILMADCQPTGGYPKIGQVMQDDLPALSQLQPNQGFTFKKCTLKDAQNALIYRKKQLDQLKLLVKRKWEESHNENSGY